MFILAVKGYEEDGAFSIENDDGDRVLLMFEEEDDADRYADLISVRRRLSRDECNRSRWFRCYEGLRNARLHV